MVPIRTTGVSSRIGNNGRDRLESAAESHARPLVERTQTRTAALRFHGGAVVSRCRCVLAAVVCGKYYRTFSPCKRLATRLQARLHSERLMCVLASQMRRQLVKVSLAGFFPVRASRDCCDEFAPPCCRPVPPLDGGTCCPGVAPVVVSVAFGPVAVGGATRFPPPALGRLRVGGATSRFCCEGVLVPAPGLVASGAVGDVARGAAPPVVPPVAPDVPPLPAAPPPLAPPPLPPPACASTTAGLHNMNSTANIVRMVSIPLHNHPTPRKCHRSPLVGTFVFAVTAPTIRRAKAKRRALLRHAARLDSIAQMLVQRQPYSAASAGTGAAGVP